MYVWDCYWTAIAAAAGSSSLLSVACSQQSSTSIQAPGPHGIVQAMPVGELR